jgi:hypothetical protein
MSNSKIDLTTYDNNMIAIDSLNMRSEAKGISIQNITGREKGIV